MGTTRKMDFVTLLFAVNTAVEDGAGDAVYACAPIVVWGRPCDSCSRAYLLPCHGLVCHSQRPVVVVEGRDSAPPGSGCRLCLSFPHRLVPLILIGLIKTIP